jgi:hypothetical protein
MSHLVNHVLKTALIVISMQLLYQSNAQYVQQASLFNPMVHVSYVARQTKLEVVKYVHLMLHVLYVIQVLLKMTKVYALQMIIHLVNLHGR